MTAATAAFDTLDGAVDTVIEVLAHAIPVARIELLDDVQIDAVNRHFELDLDGRARRSSSSSTARPEETEAQAEEVGEIAAGARRPRLRLGRGREPSAARSGTPATAPTRPAARCGPASQGFTTDACVPISRLAEVIAETKARPRRVRACSRRSSATSATATSTSRSSSTRTTPTSCSAPRRSTTGWCGARSPPTAPAPANTASATARSRVPGARARPAAVAMMRAIKSALDPNDLFNPGKVAGRIQE